MRQFPDRGQGGEVWVVQLLYPPDKGVHRTGGPVETV